jgi:hypothetical protein
VGASIVSVEGINEDAGGQELSALKAAIEMAEVVLSQAKEHMEITRAFEDRGIGPMECDGDLRMLEFSDLYTNVSPVEIVSTSNFATSLANTGLLSIPSVE